MHVGWSFAEILDLDFDQVELYATEAIRQQDERQASLIISINLASHGKPQDIKRIVNDLTRTKQKSMSIDDALKMAKKPF